jgi:hypothetical protein
MPSRSLSGKITGIVSPPEIEPPQGRPVRAGEKIPEKKYLSIM